MIARILRKFAFYFGLFIFTLFAVFPAIWAVISTFKQSTDLYNATAIPFIFNDPPTLHNIIFLLTSTPFLNFVVNSVIIGVCTVLTTVLLAVPAAYALARLSGNWGRNSGMALFLVYLIPPSLLFLPMFQLIAFLGLQNSIWGLVVVYPTLTIPFCTWLLLSFFKSIPDELDEAAMVDGCSRFTAFIRVVMPLALPGIGACVIFAFSLQLSDYVYASTFITSISQMPVSFGVPTVLMRGDVFFWQSLMAANLIVAIPLMLAYGFMFDRLVFSFQSAGVAAA